VTVALGQMRRTESKQIQTAIGRQGERSRNRTAPGRQEANRKHIIHGERVVRETCVTGNFDLVSLFNIQDGGDRCSSKNHQEIDKNEENPSKSKRENGRTKFGLERMIRVGRTGKTYKKSDKDTHCHETRKTSRV